MRGYLYIYINIYVGLIYIYIYMLFDIIGVYLFIQVRCVLLYNNEITTLFMFFRDLFI